MGWNVTDASKLDRAEPEIAIPIGLSAGESQEYVEDCPVCCGRNVMRSERGDGDPRVWVEGE